MSRRKDSRGRVLKAGESLRKDGRYQYRYTDAYGNRQCVYDEDLNRLRQKEDIINRQNLNGLENMIASRPRVRKEMVVDGYKKFLMLDKDGKPKVALHIENEFRYARKKYAKYHPEFPLPHITPHVFRHTFCTNMAFAGMDLKNLQYLMGHSDASVTMNVYTHVNYDKAAEQMSKITDFTLPDIRLKAAMKQMEAMEESQNESTKVKVIPPEKLRKLG